MEPLFRFTVIRPPVDPDPRYPPIILAQISTFLTNLARDATTNPTDPRTPMNNRATAFLTSADFVDPNLGDKTNVQLALVVSTLDKMDDSQVSSTKTSEILKTALGTSSVASFIDSAKLTDLEMKIKDTMVALRQLGAEETTGHMGLLALRLRTIETLSKIVSDTNFPSDLDDLSRWRQRPIVAPTIADFPKILSDADARIKAQAEALARQASLSASIAALFKERRDLMDAHDSIVKLSSQHLFTKPPIAQPAIPAPVQFTSIAIAQQHLQFVSSLSDLVIRHLSQGLPSQLPHINVGPPILHETSTGASAPPSGSTALPSFVAQPSATQATGTFSDGPNLSSLATATLVDLSRTMFDQLSAIVPQRDTPAFPAPTTDAHFSLLPTALPLLSTSVVNTLNAKNIDVTSRPIDSTISTLQNHLSDNATALDAQFPESQPQVNKIVRVGGTYIKHLSTSTSPWAQAFTQGLATIQSPALEPPIGKPSGRITKLLQADLLVVKQQLTGYQKGDIAYIYNVLKSERNERETTTSTSTTDTTMQETETTTDKQTDTSTADRFEMSNETQNTIKSDESLKAGATISASYGPAVKVSASASAAMDRSQTESGKAASKYSKDVTSKASDRIQKRVLQRETITRTVTTSEKEDHTFDNTGGHGHISGVYQWLNKIYEAETWCYGKRTIIDLMIPEPGAFLLDRASDFKATKSDDIIMVPPFTDTADKMSADTYPNWANLYGVTDIDPPPRAISRKSATCALAPGQPHIYSQVLTIDPGFYVTGISCLINGTTDPNLSNSQAPWVTAQCGQNFWWKWDPLHPDPVSPNVKSMGGSGEQNEVAFSVTAQSMSQFSVNIELLLQLTSEAYTNWQNLTWAKLRAAHDKLVEEQNTATQNAAFNATVAIAGTNPADNLVVMNNEIKKACIEIIADTHFNKFGAIGPSSTKAAGTGAQIDEVDIDRAWIEGPYVRFFEEAFEWEEMTWLSYPYFWGRKSNWFTKIEYEDPDPLFQQFMRAGYARANVPVRPGFEYALDHYLATGQPWDGGPLPGVSSPLFLPLATEIQESLGKSSEEPYRYPGGPWEVIVPTSLVKLRKDDETPVWTKVGDTWEEGPDNDSSVAQPSHST